MGGETFTTSSPGWYKVSSSYDNGGVAQLAEQRTHKPRVTRSIRVTATTPHFV
jgi:hypothetical protein